jgi:hypothetical protein
MCGNQKVCVELKGHPPKDLKTDLIINITENETNWSHQIDNIKKNRNNFTFLMPSYPNAYINRAKVNISIRYKQDIIYQSNYIYTRKLDGMYKNLFRNIFLFFFVEELVEDDLNELFTTFPFSNTCNDLTGALLVGSSTRMGGDIRGTKRARQ